MSNSLLKNLAYSVLDVVTLKKGVSRKINNMSVRFPARWSRYYPAEYESDNYSFLRKEIKEGMHIIDIGAHIGLFSVCASQLTGPKGKIICFEPTPDTFKILNETIKLNHCDNVFPQQAAVGGSSGKATFFVSDQMEGCNSNSLVQHQAKENVKGYDVRITTIDEICREHNIKPGLIKIDAEGAELDVLKGGRETFSTTRPLVILGLHPSFILNKGDSLSAIWKIIKEHRYKTIFDDAEMKEADFVAQTAIFDVTLIPE